MSANQPNPLPEDWTGWTCIQELQTTTADADTLDQFFSEWEHLIGGNHSKTVVTTAGSRTLYDAGTHRLVAKTSHPLAGIHYLLWEKGEPS